MQWRVNVRVARVVSTMVVAAVVASLGAVVVPGNVATVRAADQVVTSTADDGSAGTLRGAINATNGSGGGTITIGVVGTITLTSALPNLMANTTIIGNVGGTTIKTDGYRFIYSTATINVLVTDLTITGNTSSTNGAAIWRQNGTTTLQRVEITGNVATTSSFAGLIYQQQSGALTLIDGTVHNNTGNMFGSDHGGTPSGDTAASPYADSVYANRIYITNSDFADNAGCVVNSARFVTVVDSSFTGNSGLCLHGLNRKTIRNSTFTGNGVALSFSKNAAWNVPIILDAVTITGNSIGVSGAYTTTTISGSTICYNASGDLYADGGATVDVTNSFIAGTCAPPPTTTTTTTMPPPTTTTTTTTTMPPPTTTTTTTTLPATTTTTVAPTTTPPATVAPATTLAPTSTSEAPGPVPPTSTLPAPLGVEKVAPVTGLSPGGASSIDGSGAIRPLTIQVKNGDLVLTTDGTTISVSGPLPSEVGAGLVLQPGSTTQVDGDGFLAGSLVQVWLFSEPTLLGTAVAAPDGTFRLVAPVPASMLIGQHTMVVSGVRADGVAQAVSLGVVVTPAPTVPTGILPSTGGETDRLLLTAFVLVAAGTLLAVRRRPAR